LTPQFSFFILNQKMNKTTFIGDIHGRTIWKDIVQKENDSDQFVFIGDYFDSLTIPGIEQIANFKNIIEFKKTSDKEVILIIGNHDHHYLAGEIYSGYQPHLRWDIENILRENLTSLQVVYKFSDILCSHAGISPVWLDNHLPGWKRINMVEDINDLYRYRNKEFDFSHTGYDPYGDHPTQGPLWIRPDSLMSSNKGDNGLKKHYIQIVGHTQQENIFNSFRDTQKKRGGRYYLIDTLETKGYLIYEKDKNLFTPKALDTPS